MKLLRLQDNTPEIYTHESRDFQLFCRLYDCINNGFLYDASTIPSLLDTKKIRSNMLPLLKTKLGYFSNLKNIDDYSLRMILIGFIGLVKNKGSLKAIKQSINLWFKIMDITVSYQVYKSRDGDPDQKIPDHSIVICADYSFEDTSIIVDLLNYLMPAGYGIVFVSQIKFSPYPSVFLQSDKLQLLYVSNNVNSNILGSTTDHVTYEEDNTTITKDLVNYSSNDRIFRNRMLAVDSIEIIGNTDTDKSASSDNPSEIYQIPQDNSNNS